VCVLGEYVDLVCQLPTDRASKPLAAVYSLLCQLPSYALQNGLLPENVNVNLLNHQVAHDGGYEMLGHSRCSTI
jgi:hypothetical protein